MKRVLTATALACTVAASTATAQYTSQPSTYGSERESKADLVLLGGYAFTLSEDVYPTGATAGGELDVKDAAFWGIALDFNVVRQPGKQGQLRLMYRREDSEITFRPFVPCDPSVTRDALGRGRYRRLGFFHDLRSGCEGIHVAQGRYHDSG
jgi:opacity protein-like surface antigen